MIDPIDLPTGYFRRVSGLKSGCYYQATPSSAVTTNAALGNGNLRVAPMYIPKRVTITRLGAEITVAGDAASTLRLGIYNDNGSGYPGTLVSDVGTIAADAVAVAEVTISLTLEAGLYWVGAAVQGVTTTQPTVRAIQVPTTATAMPHPVPLSTSAAPVGSAVPNVGWVHLSATGALPATFSASLNLSAVAPRIFFKVA